MELTKWNDSIKKEIERVSVDLKNKIIEVRGENGVSEGIEIKRNQSNEKWNKGLCNEN